MRLNTQSQDKSFVKNGGSRAGRPAGAGAPPPSARREPPADPGILPAGQLPAERALKSEPIRLKSAAPVLTAAAAAAAAVVAVGLMVRSAGIRPEASGGRPPVLTDSAGSGKSGAARPAGAGLRAAPAAAADDGGNSAARSSFSVLPQDAFSPPAAREIQSTGEIHESPAAPAARTPENFEERRGQFLRRTARLLAAPAFPVRQAVDAASPGASLTGFGQSVTVEAAVAVADFSEPALEIVLTPGSPLSASASAPALDPAAPAAAAAGNSADDAAGETGTADRIAPEAGTAAHPPESAAPAEPGTASAPVLPGIRETPHSGFTRDEELFRTRWGWAAFDGVRRAAFEAAQLSE